MMLEQQKEVKISFGIKWDAQYGKAVYITGSIEQLGSWQSEKALRLRHSHNNHWTISVNIPQKTVLQYKFFMTNFDYINIGQIVWENTNQNHKLNIQQYPDEQFPTTSICSFNIRYLTNKDKDIYHWSSRKERIAKFLDLKAYDFVGIQEATSPQRADMQNFMGAKYDYYGRARDLGSGQECGIFIRKDRYTVIEDHYDWISENKKQGQVGYDAKLPRYFTSLLVTPRIVSTKYERIPCLLVINVHLDHQGALARREGLEQIVEKSIQLRSNCQNSGIYSLIGCVVMGDFNIWQGSSDLNILRKFQQMRFRSMRQIAGADRSFTFNGFQNRHLLRVGSFIINNHLTIDHMYYWINENERLKPLRFQVQKSENNQYLSDHYPIVGTFGL